MFKVLLRRGGLNHCSEMVMRLWILLGPPPGLRAVPPQGMLTGWLQRWRGNGTPTSHGGGMDPVDGQFLADVPGLGAEEEGSVGDGLHSWHPHLGVIHLHETLCLSHLSG